MQHFTVMQQPHTLPQQQHALKPDDKLTLSTYIADTKSSLLTLYNTFLSNSCISES